MQCGHCVYFNKDHEFALRQSEMVIFDSERKETVTKSVAMQHHRVHHELFVLLRNH